MNEILKIRLSSQRIAKYEFLDPAEIVKWMAGIQAQDESGARWSIGLRVPGSTEIDITNSIKNREILRTWLFRGTLHYVAREDLLWLLKLLAPYVIKGNTRRYEQLGLDGNVFKKSQTVLAKFLREKSEATRGELKNILTDAGISAEDQRLPYLLQHAALDGSIYISGMHGREMKFRLLSELDLQKPDLDRDELLAKLAERYFHSHGSATIYDFAWWSGLPMNDAREGLAGCQVLKEMVFEGESYWTFDENTKATIEPLACLLPPFDEYLLGYRDRDLVLDPAFAKKVNRGGGILKPTLLINGKVSGTWRQNEKGDEIFIEIKSFGKIDLEGKDAILQAASRLSNFYQKHISLNFNRILEA